MSGWPLAFLRGRHVNFGGGNCELNIKTLAVFLLALLFTGSGTQVQARARGAAGEPDYLIFQLSTDQLGTDRGFEGLGREVKAEFGAQPAGSPRYVGFGVALLTFKTPIEEMRGMVTRALDLAEETGLPVFIELDDMNFMPEYSDASMVEWTAFPKPGETHGPRAKYYWLNWGNWQALPPPPNFESQAIRQEISKRLKKGVLPPLLERLARWKKQKRQHLFAGVCVGWETGIPEYRSFRQINLLPRDKGKQVTMTAEEQGEQLGYASLHARGWTQQKIEEKARQSGQSVEDVTTDLLFQVIHDYAAFWAKTVHDAGIPKDRIYTHGVSWESLPDTEQHSPRLWAGKSSRIPPLWVSINPYSRPGYTVGSGMFEPKGMVRLLRAASATDGWGGVEAYVRGVESETAFGGYLRQLFDNGAQLVDIWGWTAPGTPYDPKRAPGALRAVHTWLEGKELPLTPAPGALPPGIAPSLQEKLKRLGGLFERQYMEGANMQPVNDLMRDFQPLLEQQKFAEAEALVDRALKLLGESSTPEAPAPQPPPGTASGGVPQSLQEKVVRLQTLAQQRQQAGADLQPVAELMQGFDPLMQQQKFSEAEALVDRALKLLGESSTPEVPAPPQQPPGMASGVPPPSLQAKMPRLRALAQQRQREGADMQPVVAIAEGIQPLLEQQKFAEAEALVDRVLKLLGEPEAAAASPQAGATTGTVPASLLAKRLQLHTLLLAKRQQLHTLDERGRSTRFGIEMATNMMEDYEPLVQQQKFAEAEALVDIVFTFLGEPSPRAEAPPQPASPAPGGPSPSLQAKIARMMALAEQRQQEGADLAPIAAIAEGIQPLLGQQKFAEAEARVDRALQLLNESGSRGRTPASNDTSLIAYSASDSHGRLDIFVAKPDGTGKRRLTQEGNRNVFPAWSPDGRRLAFASDRSGTPQIWVMDADGGNPTQLTTDGANYCPAWSPDGKRLAFASSRTGRTEIWVMESDGSKQRQLTITPAITASAKMARLVVIETRMMHGIGTPDAAGISNLFPTWSAATGQIAWCSTRSGEYAIWVMDADGGNPRQLTHPHGSKFPYANIPAYSPDGRKIVFWSGTDLGPGQIWVMNADGTNRKQLTDVPPPFTVDGPVWSPDGRQILYMDPQGGGTGIMDADGRNQRLLIRNTGERASWQSAAQPSLAPSIQAKISRMMALAEQRQQEGADMVPIAEIANGIQPLLAQQKFAEAEALADRVLKLLGEPSTPAAAPAPQAGATPGAMPPSLHAKLARVHELAQQRQQAGADMRPLVEMTQGLHQLVEQQKFSEAEAIVDRALEFLSQSGVTGERPAAGSNKEQPAASAAGAQPFPCPAAGAAIDLSSGSWALRSDCTTRGLNLSGDAQLWVEGLSLTIDGHVLLEQNAGLHVRGGSFNVANHFKFEYRLSAKGNAVMEFRDVKVAMNAGVEANLTSSYEGSGDSRLIIENVEIEPTHSWLLCTLRDRARVDTKNSRNFPSEIYPNANSTVRIEGPRSGHGVWLRFPPGSSAVIENMPTSPPYTFSFGRNTPGVTGIGYQVDVVEGNGGFGIEPYPRSNVTVRSSPTPGTSTGVKAATPMQVGYYFTDVTTPETLTGLKGGLQTRTLRNQGRVLTLENVQLPPYGWQVYCANEGIELAKVAPVTITDSLVNELAAFKNGRFEVAHMQFAFAALAAVGSSSMVHVRDSVINSHTIMGNSDGIVKVEDSEIHGSRVQAIGKSRILLLNTALRTNEPHPKCVPALPAMDGRKATRCNRYNPAHEIEFIARGQGAVLVANIEPIATAIRSGTTYAFVGDALVKTPDDKPHTYNLRYRQASASAFTTIATGATGPKRAQPLGQLDTTGLAPGDYVVELELSAPSLEPVIVRRPFTITGP